MNILYIWITIFSGLLFSQEIHSSFYPEAFLQLCKNNKTEYIEKFFQQHSFEKELYYFSDPENGYSPVHYAALNNNEKLLHLLIENGFNINAVDHIQQTPLHIAAMHNHQNITKVLLDLGANRFIKNAHGLTPLESCCGLVPWSMVELLVHYYPEQQHQSPIIEKKLSLDLI